MSGQSPAGRAAAGRTRTEACGVPKWRIGKTLDVGTDTGSPVGPYEHQFPFTGDIIKISRPSGTGCGCRW